MRSEDRTSCDASKVSLAVFAIASESIVYVHVRVKDEVSSAVGFGN
jgi:hypothetical protein